MDLESDSLLSNHTWTLVPHLRHQNVICNKWVYKLKQKVNSFIDWYRAKLVAKWFDQVSDLVHDKNGYYPKPK